MTEDQVRGLHDTVGRLADQMHALAGRVGEMGGIVQTFMNQWAVQDRTASEGRKVVYERLELMNTQITRVATDVQNMQQDVAEMRNDIDDKIMPTVRVVEATTNQKIGAKATWAMIGAAVVMGGGIVAIIDKIWSHLH